MNTDNWIDDLVYHMYESSGNSKYVLAGRKPLHPDEAAALIQQKLLEARKEELNIIGQRFIEHLKPDITAMNWISPILFDRIEELSQLNVKEQ